MHIISVLNYHIEYLWRFCEAKSNCSKMFVVHFSLFSWFNLVVSIWFFLLKNGPWCLDECCCAEPGHRRFYYGAMYKYGTGQVKCWQHGANWMNSTLEWGAYCRSVAGLMDAASSHWNALSARLKVELDYGFCDEVIAHHFFLTKALHTFLFSSFLTFQGFYIP